MIEGDVSACMIFSSIKKKKKITYHTGKQAVDIMSEMKTELGPDIKKKLSLSSFCLTTTGIALMIVRFYVHADFIKSR